MKYNITDLFNQDDDDLLSRLLYFIQESWGTFIIILDLLCTKLIVSEYEGIIYIFYCNCVLLYINLTSFDEI